MWNQRSEEKGKKNHLSVSYGRENENEMWAKAIKCQYLCNWRENLTICGRPPPLNSEIKTIKNQSFSWKLLEEMKCQVAEGHKRELLVVLCLYLLKFMIFIEWRNLNINLFFIISLGTLKKSYHNLSFNPEIWISLGLTSLFLVSLSFLKLN